MLIRKPSVLLATYNSFYSFPSNLSGSSTSSKRKRERTRQCQYCQNGEEAYASIAGRTRQWQGRARYYATIAGGDAHHDEQAEQAHPPPWPKPPEGQSSPTPYQIFEMHHNAVYTKARFYQLVKLYHPDRIQIHTPTPDSARNVHIPHAIKMERYRLIVAANDILSDPTKRSAYDRFGAGWNGKAGIRRRDDDPAGPFSQNWNSDPSDPIWRNATWEDWERFYHARAKRQGTATAEGVHRPHHTGLYLQNSYFLVLVMVLALMGSTANYTRAQTEGQYFVDQRDIIHDRAAKELRRARQEALTSGSKSDRVQWFLRNREATMGVPGSDVETLREEKVDRLLPEREICRSDGISDGASKG